MRILVIDNKTKGMLSLEKSLKGLDYDVIGYNKITPGILKKYDRIILSGGHAFNVVKQDKKYSKEMKLIKNSKKPLLGICLGFQLVCRTYGARLGTLRKYEHGLVNIRTVGKDSLLKGMPKKFRAFENHRHNMKDVGKSLIPLAYSKDGVEMVKHKSKKVWGTQFHPENFSRKNIGRKVLENFIS